MRLFIAITIPEDIREMLAVMGNSIQGARGTPAEQIHVTVRFIGETEGTLFHDIRDALREVAMPPFSLTIKGVGHFPPRGTPKIIWAGLSEAEQLIRLKKRIDRALLQCGLPAEDRKFAPHITLARCKTTSIGRATDFLSGNALFSTRTFAVDSFQLFSSLLTSHGAHHQIEADYTLHPSPPR